MDLIERAAAKLAEQQPEAPGPTPANSRISAADLDLQARTVEIQHVNAAIQARLQETVASPVTDPGANKFTLNLDFKHLRQQGLIVPDESRSQIKEEYRHIKRPLLQNVSRTGPTAPEHPNLIMVTSALPNEGKSFTAINLALSIAAERNKTVLLVDADVLKPSLSHRLGMPELEGLTEYLHLDHPSLADYLIKTDLPNLTLLPAGRPHYLANELLASDHMRSLMQELSQRYSDRIVIFDSPPLLSTSEAYILARMMGQIMMVIEAERTTKAQVQEALSHLDLDERTVIGTVFNKASRSQSETYGYGYGYGSIR